jgi:hypothetical protein
LFLDRSHARARAYIDRARSALAERQRESEELLHTGLAAFSRGEGDEARRLLQAAMKQGAPPDEALAALDRLSRLEQGSAPRPAATVRADRLPVPRVDNKRRTRRWGFAVSTIAIALVAAGGFFVVAGEIDWRSPFASGPARPPAPTATGPLDGGLPIPLRGETVLDRARGLQARGRLLDALSTLDLVRPTDTQRADADRLRASIQHQLLGLSSVDAATPPESSKGDGPLP